MEKFEDAMDRLCKAYNVPFHTALVAVLESFKFADWAVIARAVDGNKFGTWEAGDGENPVGSRERAMIMVGEMEDLKDTIIQYWRKRQEIAK